MSSIRRAFLLFACSSLMPLLASAANLPFEQGPWKIAFDSETGGLTQLQNANRGANLLREAGRWEKGAWVALPSRGQPAPDAWGLVETAFTGSLHHASLKQLSPVAWEMTYVSPALTVSVRRELDRSSGLLETYRFTNTGLVDLDFPVGSISITAPLFDQYPDARRSLNSRFHAHVWMGGGSAWINAMSMGAKGPNLGLTLTKGSLEAYSQRGGSFGDRGTFLLHPGALTIKSGETATLAWRLFWHQGWDDFFKQLAQNPAYIRLTADRYTALPGETIHLQASSLTDLSNARMSVNGKELPTHLEGKTLCAELTPEKPGELLVQIFSRLEETSFLRAHAAPDPITTIAKRVRFIVGNQQRAAPGSPLDGAYLAFDNSTNRQVYSSTLPDHNAGRERVGMGVLAALYLRKYCDESFKPQLLESLERYAAFVERELEDDEGRVYGSVGRTDGKRLYNYPWVAHFHLARYQISQQPEELDRFVRVIKKYYEAGGARFYAIGLPVSEGLRALSACGHKADHDELLALFRGHADHFVANGIDYPASEVNFEQSIVAPAIQLLLEVYLETGDRRYLDAAKLQMPLLECFNGRQPDHRLNEVAIRHWDDYWFGKTRLYGDTMPHYWSSLTGISYALYARATSDRSWAARAETVLRGNLSLFSTDGRASAAHLYPLASNGQPAGLNDAWANDQDWALVNWLMLADIAAL